LPLLLTEENLSFPKYAEIAQVMRVFFKQDLLVSVDTHFNCPLKNNVNIALLLIVVYIALTAKFDDI